MSATRTIKELIRHLRHRAGFRRREAHLAAASRGERFASIYSDRVWTLGRADVPLSGTGSSLAATEDLRKALPGVVRELGVETLVDVGCGDFTWMSQIDLGCRYVGVDIVPSVIEHNRQAHGSQTRQFMVHDIVAEPAPAGDLILCREVLFHLSFADGLAALRNMASSGARYLLLTTDRVTDFNADIETGDFRLLNLEKRPYRLPEPELRIQDDKISEGRFVGLWSAPAVLAALDGSRAS
ncbi:MAG: class I SAM-dependent methyltransferase [Cypionkella sp.]